MIVLDTNVVSEMMKAERDRRVVAWLRRHPADAIFTTTVNVAEILSGVGFLPAGRRQDDMRAIAVEIFERVFRDRILPFDRAAADAYAEILPARRRMGRPIKEIDAEIAAISRTHGMALATRDFEDFSDCGVDVINPWSA